MSINKDIFNVQDQKKCIVNRLPFSEEQRAVFDEVMEEDDTELYPNAKIIDVVRNQWGINLKSTALSSHRRKVCMCYTFKQESK